VIVLPGSPDHVVNEGIGRKGYVKISFCSEDHKMKWLSDGDRGQLAHGHLVLAPGEKSSQNMAVDERAARQERSMDYGSGPARQSSVAW